MIFVRMFFGRASGNLQKGDTAKTAQFAAVRMVVLTRKVLTRNCSPDNSTNNEVANVHGASGPSHGFPAALVNLDCSYIQDALHRQQYLCPTHAHIARL